MKRQVNPRISAQIVNFSLPRYEQIPNVGLYLEQATKYVCEYLAPLGEYTLTPSMISNYVKKGIVPKPVKKQYFAEHVAYLFFVAMAKNLVSIENIGLLIEMQRNTYTLPVAFDYMGDCLKNTLDYIFGLKSTLEPLGETESDEKNILSSLIFSTANVIHMHACFSQIRAEQEEI